MADPRPISKQISSISSSLVIGLLALSVVAVAVTLLVRVFFSEFRMASQTTLIGNAVLEDILEARLAATKWRLNPIERKVEEFQSNLAEVFEAEKDAEEVLGPDAELTQTLRSSAVLLREYSETFGRMVEARAAYEAIEADMAEAGIAARRTLTKLMTNANDNADAVSGFYAGTAQEGLMLGRYYLERFRQTENPDDLNRSVAEMDTAREQLNLLLRQDRNSTRVELAQNALGRIESFVSQKEELSGLIQNQIEGRERLDQIGPRVVSAVEADIDAAVDAQNALGQRTQLLTFWAVAILAIAAICISGVGLRVARKLSHKITQEIETAVAAMSRLAEGDLETKVPTAEADNELGRMARALEIFKSNGKEAREAAEREKHAEEARRKEAETQKRQQEEQKAAAEAKAAAARQAMVQSLSTSVGKVLDAASRGDFSQRVIADFDEQEFVDLAQAVNTLVEDTATGIGAVGTVMSRVAEGNLTSQMEGNFQGAFKELQDNTNQMIVSLRDLVGSITTSSATVADSSSELRDTSETLSTQAEQNAASLEETSAALEELTASIKQMSENISAASSNAQQARSTAQSSGTVASAAADAMSQISDASKEISSVVTVINDIAFQINLLALNAGVEAARAGESGRGFSVVASEVRQLSQRASEAAKEIEDVIVRSDVAVADGVTKVAEAQASLQKISERAVGVSESIDEISNAVSEQVAVVGEINAAVSRIDQSTQKQAASFEEVTAASGLLSSEAAGLKQSTSQFKTGAAVAAMPSRERAA